MTAPSQALEQPAASEGAFHGEGGSGAWRQGIDRRAHAWSAIAICVALSASMGCMHVHAAERRILFRAEAPAAADPEDLFHRLEDGVLRAGYVGAPTDLGRGEITVQARTTTRTGEPHELRIVAHLDGTVEIVPTSDAWVNRRRPAPRRLRALEAEAIALAASLMESVGDVEHMSYPLAVQRSRGR